MRLNPVALTECCCGGRRVCPGGGKGEGHPVRSGFQSVDGGVANALAVDFIQFAGTGKIRCMLKLAGKVFNDELKGIQPALRRLDKHDALPVFTLCVFLPSERVLVRVRYGLRSVSVIGVLIIVQGG